MLFNVVGGLHAFMGDDFSISPFLRAGVMYFTGTERAGYEIVLGVSLDGWIGGSGGEPEPPPPAPAPEPMYQPAPTQPAPAAEPAPTDGGGAGDGSADGSGDSSADDLGL
jgi:hypothetical protein